MSLFNSTPPKIKINYLIKWLKVNYNFLNKRNFKIKNLNSERDRNFLVIINNKFHYVIKISNSIESKNFLEMQDYVLTSLNKKPLIKKIIPKKLHRSIKVFKDDNSSLCFVRILNYIEGEIFAKSKKSFTLESSLGSYIGILSKELQNIGHPASFRNFEWDPSNIDWIKNYLNLFKNKQKKIINKNLYEYNQFVKKNKNNLRFSLTHGDPNNYNLIVSNNQIVGLLDYGDMIYAPTINDLSICLAYALMNKESIYDSLKNIVTNFHNKFPITFEETYSLMSLVKSRLSITVVMAAKQIKKFPNNKYLTISEKDAWSLLYKLDKIDPHTFIYFIRNICNFPIDPNVLTKIPKTFLDKELNISDLLKKRSSFLGKNFSISYKKPLQFLEAKDQYLYDEKGQQYLDCVNNISHVGHCHPVVHEALIKQNLKLNTNTRYIYKIMNDYSEKLLSKFPKKLDTVFFVCTGSEANDLAYRIAKIYTKSKDVLVMNNAYHGHTNELINLSPYKFNGKGGEGKKSYVHVAEMPDGIRGKWKYSHKDWVNKYINQAKILIEKINYKKKKLSCFFTESILGCGGQIILPKNYLKEIYKLVKKNNSLFIVDEVQTGFARVGNHFWAFEEHGIVPDIVTLGKPMGNGHPLAAVITTKEIAEEFNNGMEYFNSFGGNPVSCAVGNAVLDVIKIENLQSHSYNTGKYLLESLKKIQNKYPDLISEVRGRGLFLGIDLIQQNNLSPNKKLANLLINHMRDKRILLSTDGPYNNVIKIKPPLPFNNINCDQLTYELNQFFKNL